MATTSRINVRTSFELREDVKRAAASEGKSMNAFVIRALELGLGDPPRTPAEAEMVRRLRDAGLLPA